jgi:hypothetical protein
MYLLSELNLFPFMLLLALWTLGGWLILSRLFDLPAHERGLLGLGVGLIISTLLANFLGRFIPTTAAFWLAGILTLVIGLALCFPVFRFSGFPSYRVTYLPVSLFTFLLITFFFTLTNRGLAIFDDYQNLPQVASIALGDLPPHFAFDARVLWSYHYFLLLVAAQFTRLADAAPWVALDLARGLTLALTLFYGGFLAQRLTRSRTAGLLASAFILFVGGARWLLLLLPARILNLLSSSVTLIGSGADTGPNLTIALTKYWNIQGLGPLPFPFLYGSGLDPSLTMAFAGYGASMVMLVLMVLLLVGSMEKGQTRGLPLRYWLQQAVLAVLLAALALANEVTFAFLYAGLILVALFWVIKNRSLRLPKSLLDLAPAILGGGILALVEGGIFTGAAAGFLGKLTGSAVESHYVVSFGLRAPAVLSAHLGDLSLLNPLQWLAILAETGLVILVLPWVVKFGLEQIRDEKWLEAAWIFSIVPSLLTVFLVYTGNAGPTALSRLTAHFLTVLKIYAVPLLWIWVKERSETVKMTLLGWGFAACLSGIALFSLQITAMPAPQTAEFLTDLDAQMYAKFWGKLPSDALVFDTTVTRATTVLGLHTISSVNYGPPTDPTWLALEADPDPHRFNAAGFRYLYADIQFWRKYAERFSQPCVQTLSEVQQTAADGKLLDLRRLVDVSKCRK